MTFDFAFFWTWFLAFTRTSALLFVLPGLGTEEVPHSFRGSLALALSVVIAGAIPVAPAPQTLAEGGLMILSEFAFGYVIGVLPAFVIASLGIAGQVSSTAMGLAQANLIDPSLGEHVTALTRLKSLLGTMIFLTLDGHHLILRAAAGQEFAVGTGAFRPDGMTAQFLVDRFQHSLALAVSLIGPVLVAVILTNFVLGLITKFVPQVNIFIISLPLTIGLGLFLTNLTLPALVRHVVHEFGTLSEQAATLFGVLAF